MYQRTFDDVTAREKTLEQRRKDHSEFVIRGKAVSIARKIISLKGQITLNEMEKMSKKI